MQQLLKYGIVALVGIALGLMILVGAVSQASQTPSAVSNTCPSITMAQAREQAAFAGMQVIELDPGQITRFMSHWNAAEPPTSQKADAIFVGVHPLNPDVVAVLIFWRDCAVGTATGSKAEIMNLTALPGQGV